jgi:hypothetical protein
VGVVAVTPVFERAPFAFDLFRSQRHYETGYFDALGGGTSN